MDILIALLTDLNMIFPLEYHLQTTFYKLLDVELEIHFNVTCFTDIKIVLKTSNISYFLSKFVYVVLFFVKQYNIELVQTFIKDNTKINWSTSNCFQKPFYTTFIYTWFWRQSNVFHIMWRFTFLKKIWS